MSKVVLITASCVTKDFHQQKSKKCLSFTCVQCESRFSSEKSFKEHMKSHQTNSEADEGGIEKSAEAAFRDEETSGVGSVPAHAAESTPLRSLDQEGGDDDCDSIVGDYIITTANVPNIPQEMLDSRILEFSQMDIEGIDIATLFSDV